MCNESGFHGAVFSYSWLRSACDGAGAAITRAFKGKCCDPHSEVVFIDVGLALKRCAGNPRLVRILLGAFVERI